MARPSLHVRAATDSDLPALVAFGEELRDLVIAPAAELGGRSRGGSPASARAFLEQRYLEAVEDPARELVVVVGEDDVPVGMALLTIAPANALVDIPAVHMSHAVVSDRHKRRGAGRALVAAATTYAEQHGVEQLVVSVHPGSRDANRFFARLGFAPLAVRRTAPVTAVRRRLTQVEPRPVAEHVVRRRPRRTRALTGLPLGPSVEVDPAT
ncbi:MAG: GNAT family N-acetyltransferase [Actinomycetota bacterium]|nr:GNAT family N-acetyltransferase [Actinomycetota bacterium]